MEKNRFQSLIQAVTGRDLIISCQTENLQLETEYRVFRKLPITQKPVSFYWKTPKSEEKMLRSFITAFTTKYREPNPACYSDTHYFTQRIETWDEMSAEKREYCYNHHSSNMYSKQQLMSQIESRFALPEIEGAMKLYGFYYTEYGIGIYILFGGKYVENAVQSMKDYLTKRNLTFSNEFSDALWVLRFKLGLTKEIHANILKSFT